MKTTWEESQKKYNLLLTNLNSLIEETNKILYTYQQANIGFGYHLYGDDLIPLLKKTGCYEFYEEEFRKLHKHFQDHLQGLNHLRDRVHMMIIRDEVNYPSN
ncbi:hypothetical protein C900_00503 [Fulvivirga imtechensis AK7]|uniref:Uncharacterized protein n=1 Tax=Fulvivirga imtechensis AK7 TaxID=1237149 RepID=L8JVC9_9BACT|nr:hypothetical protein [Fulvivirga imtechensis]ELR73001.1 hypothetical protein C900_00503 [Fulvivirga imtechensis AK7]